MLHSERYKGKTKAFMLGRPMECFTIEKMVTQGKQTTAQGKLEFCDMTEPIGSHDRNVLIDWKATSIPGADMSANWLIVGSRESKLDDLSPAVNTALRQFVTNEMNRFVRRHPS